MPGLIRRATEADRARISEIRFSVKENVLRDPSRVPHEMVTWFIENPGIWLWEEDGKVLGFSAADTRDGTIFALFIDPAHEGRGIGRALFAKALDSLREAGHETGSLTTQPGSRADRFYQRAGWKAIGTSERGERIFHGVL
jgi:GNAT superfamily N-acetyltransferase